MKYILLCICLLSLLGCGTDTKTQQDSKPTTANEQAKTDQGQDAHVMVAKQALSSGDYAKTIEEASASIKDNPNNAEAYSIRGFATALNKKSYDLDPNNVANYYNMAMVYKLQGQLNESKQWFEKVLEKDPSNTWSVYGIATIYADQGDDTKALDWLEKAINIDPSVKAVAAEQDHFERFHNNARFKTLVGL